MNMQSVSLASASQEALADELERTGLDAAVATLLCEVEHYAAFWHDAHTTYQAEAER